MGVRSKGTLKRVLTREILFHPAYDLRSKDPDRNYGVHGVEMRWILRGKEGVVQWLVFTPWMLPKVQAETDKYIIGKSLSGTLDPIQLKVSYKPMPADLGYHSLTPRYEGQEPLSESCEFLDGKPCYYDGSSLNAEPVFYLLVSKGHEAVWRRLEEYYESTFGGG